MYCIARYLEENGLHRMSISIQHGRYGGLLTGASVGEKTEAPDWNVYGICERERVENMRSGRSEISSVCGRTESRPIEHTSALELQYSPSSLAETERECVSAQFGTREGLRHEVGRHLRGWAVLEDECLVSYEFSNEMISNINMFRSGVKHIDICNEIECALVVAAQ